MYYKVYNSFNVIRTVLCIVPYLVVGFPLIHGIEDDCTFQHHPFEPTMELWSMAAEGFVAIFSTKNSDSASFSYELPYKGNFSSNDNDEH